jgi:hypothetical protein
MKIADVIVVMMGDQYRIDRLQWHIQSRELPYHAAAGIDQDAVLSGPDQQRGCAPRDVGPRATGPEQRD